MIYEMIYEVMNYEAIMYEAIIFEVMNYEVMILVSMFDQRLWATLC